jgi:hypothetical protein
VTNILIWLCIALTFRNTFQALNRVWLWVWRINKHAGAWSSGVRTWRQALWPVAMLTVCLILLCCSETEGDLICGWSCLPAPLPYWWDEVCCRLSWQDTGNNTSTLERPLILVSSVHTDCAGRCRCLRCTSIWYIHSVESSLNSQLQVLLIILLTYFTFLRTRSRLMRSQFLHYVNVTPISTSESVDQLARNLAWKLCRWRLQHCLN